MLFNTQTLEYSIFRDFNPTNERALGDIPIAEVMKDKKMNPPGWCELCGIGKSIFNIFSLRRMKDKSYTPGAPSEPGWNNAEIL